MAEAVPAGEGFTLIMYLNCGVTGWTEEYYWAGDTSSWGPVEQDAARLASARADLLTAKAKILGVRVTRFTDPGRAGQPLFPTKLLAGPSYAPAGRAPEAPAHPLPPWVALGLRAYDATRTHAAPRQLGGLSRQSVEWTPAGPTGFSPAGFAQSRRLLALLANSPMPGDRLRGRWCLAGQSRDPAATGVAPVLVADPSPLRCFTEVVTAKSPIWRPGDTVYLSLPYSCNTRGLPGSARVLAVDGLRTTITSLPACCGPFTLGPRPTIRLETSALYAYALVDVQRVTTRTTGGPFLPMSWAPAAQNQPGCCAPVSTGVECLAVHPCGMILDFLRVAYAARMRTFAGGEASPVVWFEAPPGASVYEGETVFRSRIYTDPYRPYDGVGEQMDSCWSLPRHRDVLAGRWCERRDGSAPAPYLGRTPCGAPETWSEGGTRGVTPEIVTDRAGRPPCCLPLSTPGGQREGGRQPAVGPGGEREGGALTEGPTRQAGGEREGGSLHPGPAGTAGGEREGGRPPRTAPGGEREGGAHLVGPTTARGGEREGGSLRPGPGRPAGGEREGGAGHQVGPPESAGGEREGGRLPRVAPGGEREGGTPTHGPATVAGGQREGGRLPRTPPGGEREGGGVPALAGGGEREGGRPAGTSAGGQSEGGRPPALAPGGESEGGRPPRVLPGGEREGGSAPPLARGGEREGGAHPVFTAGGESEGGPLPGLAFGGQSEGGAPPALVTGGESEGGSIPRTPAGGQREGGTVPPVAAGGEREGGVIASGPSPGGPTCADAAPIPGPPPATQPITLADGGLAWWTWSEAAGGARTFRFTLDTTSSPSENYFLVNIFDACGGRLLFGGLADHADPLAVTLPTAAGTSYKLQLQHSSGVGACLGTITIT